MGTLFSIRRMIMAEIINTQKFEEIFINGKGSGIVDFYADWCGPCKMLAPILEEVDASVYKINVDKDGALAAKFGIVSIPTLLFFKDGELYDKVVGLVSKEEIEERLGAL